MAKEKNVLGDASYQYDVLNNFQGLGKFVYDCNVKYSDKVAQIDASTDITETYGELNKRCIQLALELKSQGIQPGDIITVCSFNSMDVCLPIVAGWYVGAVLSFLDPTLSLPTTTHLLGQVRPKMIFCSSNSTELIEKSLKSNKYSATIVVFDEKEPNGNLSFSKIFKEYRNCNDFELYIPDSVQETAIILFSSGTTGLAKGICLPHYGLLFGGLHWAAILKDVKVTLSFTSFYWISGMCSFLISCLLSATRVIVPFFNIDTALGLLEKYKASFTITSTIMNQYLKSKDWKKYDLSNMKCVLVGGTPSTAEQILDVHTMFPSATIRHGYGMTELCGVIMCFHDVCLTKEYVHSKPGSVGMPAPGLLCKVVDIDTDESLGPNKLGELKIKSPSIMNGYYGCDSSEAWDPQGWLCTGDIGYYDDEGCFYIADRIKDMLKFQSWHVTPSAIEAVLMQHPKVKEAVVIGIPHEVDGDLAMGIVVLHSNESELRCEIERELVKFVEDRMGYRDRLHGGLKIVDNIPRTPSGKSKRRDLRTMIQEGRL